MTSFVCAVENARAIVISGEMQALVMTVFAFIFRIQVETVKTNKVCIKIHISCVEASTISSRFPSLRRSVNQVDLKITPRKEERGR